MEYLATQHMHGRLVSAVELAGLPDNLLHQTVIPEDTMEWRAAEWGIDPSEVDTLLDIVIYQEHFDEKIQPLDFPGPTDARGAMIAMLARTKQRVRPQGPNQWKDKKQRADRIQLAGVDDPAWVEAITDDALERFRTHSLLDPEVVAEKARFINERRARRLGHPKRFITEKPQQDRLGRIRAALGTNHKE